jgi:quinol monooxygenase YgiN
MGKVSVMATLKVKDGKGDSFAEQFDDLFDHITANEGGTVHYVLHRSTTDPNTFFMTEIYDDQAGLDAHMGSDAFAQIGASLAEYVESADLQFAEPVRAAKGLDL